MTRWLRAGAIALALLLVAALAWGVRAWRHDDRQLAQRLGAIVGVASQPLLDCRALAAARPLVLLALGQSNAANHGSPAAVDGLSDVTAVTMLAEGRCLRARDPLPGGTGRGGSIWSRLEPALQGQGLGRPVLISVLAVDASSIGEWTRGPLAQRLRAHLAMLGRHGFLPDLVLWQQGEADAKLGTSQFDYQQGLRTLADTLAGAGVSAPLLLAKSTVCRSGPSQALRAAVDASVASHAGLRAGPDTDLLAGPAHRSDGCHFTARGLDDAAHAWAAAIMQTLRSSRVPGVNYHGCSR